MAATGFPSLEQAAFCPELRRAQGHAQKRCRLTRGAKSLRNLFVMGHDQGVLRGTDT
jgi:hypothetical protein